MSQTILIVEDEPIIAQDLKDRLEDLGYRVGGVCASGEEALETFPGVQPDLTLMDVNLAGKLDGIQTALKLRADHDLRLIFLTSNTDDVTFDRARQAQPLAFLSKPFRGRDLKHAIELALGSSPATVAAPNKTEPKDGQIVQDRIFVSHKDRLVRLLLKDIYWFEADDYYAKAVTAEREYLVTKTLKKVSGELLHDPNFFRASRSYLINLKRVTEIGEIHLFFDKKKVLINKSGRDKVVRRLHNL